LLPYNVAENTITPATASQQLSPQQTCLQNPLTGTGSNYYLLILSFKLAVYSAILSNMLENHRQLRAV